MVDEDVFDGEGGDFGEEDAAEGVGDGGVDADEGEGEVERFLGVELDLEVLHRELVLHPFYTEDSHSNDTSLK